MLSVRSISASACLSTAASDAASDSFSIEREPLRSNVNSVAQLPLRCFEPDLAQEMRASHFESRLWQRGAGRPGSVVPSPRRCASPTQHADSGGGRMPTDLFIRPPVVGMHRRQGVHVLAPSPRRAGSPRHLSSRPQTVSGQQRAEHALPPLENSSWALALTTCPEQVVRNAQCFHERICSRDVRLRWSARADFNFQRTSGENGKGGPSKADGCAHYYDASNRPTSAWRPTTPRAQFTLASLYR